MHITGAAGLAPISSSNREILRMLLEAGAEVDARADGGWTPLHFAARVGKADAVRELVRGGAVVHARTNEGETALMLAVKGGHEDAARELRKTRKKMPDVKVEM